MNQSVSSAENGKEILNMFILRDASARDSEQSRVRSGNQGYWDVAGNMATFSNSTADITTIPVAPSGEIDNRVFVEMIPGAGIIKPNVFGELKFGRIMPVIEVSSLVNTEQLGEQLVQEAEDGVEFRCLPAPIETITGLHGTVRVSVRAMDLARRVSHHPLRIEEDLEDEAE